MAAEITDPGMIAPDVHTGRLDADMFNADDIDGATESLNGSGNLSYLALQSSQTNEAARNFHPFSQNGNNDSLLNGGIFPLLSNHAGEGSGHVISANMAQIAGQSQQSDSYQNFPAITQSTDNLTSIINGGHNGGNNGHNFFSSTSHIFPGSNGVNGGDGSGQNGGSGDNGSNGSNGTDGSNGNDGNNPPPPPPVDSSLGIHVVSDLLSANVAGFIDPIGNALGGVNADVTGTLGDILSPGDGFLPHPGAILDAAIGNNQILNDMHLGPYLGGAENTLDSAVSNLNGMIDQAAPWAPNLLDTASGILGDLNGGNGIFVTGNLNLPNAGGLGGIGDLAGHIPVSPIVDSLLGTTDLHLGITSDQSNLLDNGLSLEPVDISLASTGDVLPGLNLDVNTADPLGSILQAAHDAVGYASSGNLVPDLGQIAANLPDSLNTVTDPVTSAIHDAASSLAGDALGGVLGGGGTGGADTDLVANTGIDIGNQSIDLPVLTATLDPVENIAGDIDLGINAHTDAVNQLLAGDPAGAASSLTDTLTNAVDLNFNPLTPEVNQTAPLDIAANGDDSLTGIVTQTADSVTSTDLTGSLSGNTTMAPDLSSIATPIDQTVSGALADSGTATDLAVLPADTTQSMIGAITDATNIDTPNLAGSPDSAINTGSLTDILSGTAGTDTGAAWPEATVASATTDVSTVTDTTSALADAVLPDPGGLVSDGLNLVHDVTSDPTGGLLGGHHGELFG